MTVMEAIFVRAFLARRFNARAAAIEAGAQPKSAAVTGHNMLRRPRVAAAIERILRPRLQSGEKDLDRILQELWTVALLDEQGLAAWGAIPTDKVKALELLMRYFNLLPQGGRTRVFAGQGMIGVETDGAETQVFLLPDNGRGDLDVASLRMIPAVTQAPTNGSHAE